MKSQSKKLNKMFHKTQAQITLIFQKLLKMI